MSSSQRDHWANRTIQFLQPLLRQAEQRVRIATGFFTIQGYDLLRDPLAEKQVLLMVGYDDQGKERLRERLIDEIMFHLRIWDGDNRRAAVLALVDQLKHRRFRLTEQQPQPFLDGRVRDRDHAKVYIADEALAIVGSGNLTVNGLRQNVEGMALVPPERVAYWVDRFEQHWHDPQTVDLTQALLDALLAWLTLHPPYDVYLKTIAALIGEDDTPPPRPDYKMPVQYQQVVIERLLRQLEDWRGAMLVASTGLGKTVMATHTAYRLLLARKILNVIVLAPLQVLPNWQESMASGGIACETFTRDLLDRPLRQQSHQVRRLVAALERADDRYIIFVDESHHFKNRLRAKDGRTRHSFDRLQAAVGRGAMVVLLTATPLAKGVEDVNNQLYLLPHTAERRYVTAIGQHVIPGTRDDELDLNAWKVGDHEAFFSDFINLPVTTVISTSQVARNFADRTPEGDVIRFGQEKRWLPSVAIKKVRVPVPVEAGMSAALAGDAFKHKLKRFQSRGAWQISESTIHNQAIVAWTSSPAALREIVSNTLDGTYDEKWLCPRDKQRALLEPIYSQLEALPTERDEKFLALCHILAEARQTGQKAIIFTERHSTAHYLEQQLAQRLPGLRVASVVAQQDGKYRLKDFNKEVQELIIGFAPEANKDIAESRDYEPYDAFISTDAYSTGVNLQDASIVINYDLAWTPDTIIQRAGRILRLWHTPRRVTIYVFVGDFQADVEGQQHTEDVVRRLRTLTQRGRQAEQFSEIPVFSDAEIAEYDSLGSLANVTIEDLGLADIEQIEEFTGVSGFLHHITELKQNADYANSIPDDISSALAYPGDRHLLYLLLRYEREYYWTLYDISQDKLEAIKEDELLNLIRCSREAPVAPIDAHVIEGYAQDCRRLWLDQHPLPDHEKLERICALYLVPEAEGLSLGHLLQRQLWAS